MILKQDRGVGESATEALRSRVVISIFVAEVLSELKNWWKELVLVFLGAVLLLFVNQLGWVAAAVLGIVILVVGVAILSFDLGKKMKGVTTPGEGKERVLETIVEIDQGEDYEKASYYFERGDRVLVEADSRVRGKRFSLLVVHESDLPTYEKDEGPYTLVSVDNTVLHRERFVIPEEGFWHFIIEPEWSEDVSVELSVWKLQ